MTLKDEKKCFASKIAIYIYYLKSVHKRKQKILKFKDKILVGNHTVDSQKDKNSKLNG